MGNKGFDSNIGKIVEHAKKAVSPTFSMTEGKTKTTLTVCFFHIGTVTYDKNLYSNK